MHRFSCIDDCPPSAFAVDRTVVTASNFAELKNAVTTAGSTPTQIKITSDFETKDWEGIDVGNNQDILVTDDGSAHTITLNSHCGYLFEVTGANAKLTIDSTTGADSLTFVVGPKVDNIQIFFGTILMGSEGSTITLKHGKLTNNNTTASYMLAGLVTISDSATFVMDGGVIGDFSIGNVHSDASYRDSAHGQAAIANFNGGHTIMNGGEIRNITIQNAHPEGMTLSMQSPVLVYSQFENSPSSFTMNGGSIHDNKVDGIVSAGAVTQIYYGNVIINGGTISNNTVTNSPGGAITIGGYVDRNNETPADKANAASFTMNGGTITGNASLEGDAKNGQGGFGGGIYLNTSSVQLNGGVISNNKSDGQGGGIYISKPPIVNTFNNVLVYDNHASIMGGGLWYCPTGSGNLSSLGGIAVYNNKADKAADDLALLGSNEGSTMTVESRTLGAGLAHWVYDGKIERVPDVPEHINLGRVTEDSTRYDASNPLYVEAAKLKQSSDSFALKSLASEATIEAASAKGKVKIFGNSAKRGGGIATNATVNGGTPTAEDWNVKVKAVWDDSVPADKRIDFKARLLNKNLAPKEDEAAGDNLEIVSLLDMANADNFEATYHDFVPNDLHFYQVEALLDSNLYEVTVDPATADDAARTTSFVIHIKYKEPSEPDTPTSPDKPGERPKPKPETPAKEVKKNSLPKTSDPMLGGLSLALIAAAGLSLAFALKLKDKKR